MKTLQVTDSTLIKQIAFDKGTLAIELTSGKKYAYAKVSAKVVTEFMNSESKGKFFNESIKGVYESQEIGQ